MKRTAFHRIRKFRVFGGFLDGVLIEFGKGLNCIIGPRGAGKSTVLELIRFALDAMPGREGDPLRRRIENVVRTNLQGGRVELEIETKDGMAYTITRTLDSEPIVMDSNGNPISLKGSRLIPADVYSQNQIENIAETPHYQLDLIDKFAEAELTPIVQSLEMLEIDVQANTGQIIPLLQQQTRLTEQIKERPLVEEKLKAFTKAGGQDAAAINKAHTLKALRDRETNAIGSASDVLKTQAQHIKKIKGSLAGELPALFSNELLDGPNGKLLKESLKLLHSAATEADDFLEQAVDRLRAAYEKLKSLNESLSQAHATQEIEFRKLIEKHKETQAQSVERTKLERRRNELIGMERQLTDVTKQLNNLEQHRTDLMTQLSERRDERFAARMHVAQVLNDELKPAINVEVRQFGEREQYRLLVERALSNSGVRKQLVGQRVITNLAPSELYDIVRSKGLRDLMSRCQLNENQATAVLNEMSKPENLYELETVGMDDAPSVQLNDGGSYKDSGSLSTGQKCTAILPILLFESANPLLIDQPEDNLDNGFVFDTVVKSIHKVSGSRQLIFVTHNPNIPVLGEASRVMVLQSNGQSASLRATGNVDACKEHIVTLLEGGEEAFKKRMHRYEY
jgi:ABC-type lipoprotein export system ATPase subunit